MSQKSSAGLTDGCFVCAFVRHEVNPHLRAVTHSLVLFHSIFTDEDARPFYGANRIVGQRLSCIWHVSTERRRGSNG